MNIKTISGVCNHQVLDIMVNSCLEKIYTDFGRSVSQILKTESCDPEGEIHQSITIIYSGGKIDFPTTGELASAAEKEFEEITKNVNKRKV